MEREEVNQRVKKSSLLNRVITIVTGIITTASFVSTFVWQSNKIMAKVGEEFGIIKTTIENNTRSNNQLKMELREHVQDDDVHEPMGTVQERTQRIEGAINSLNGKVEDVDDKVEKISTDVQQLKYRQ